MEDYVKEAEEQLIGRLLLQPHEMTMCVDLSSDDFLYMGRHYDLMRFEYQASGGIVIGKISAIFAQNDIPRDEAAILSANVIGGNNAETLKQVVKGYATRRAVIKAATEAIHAANDLSIHPMDCVSKLSAKQNDLVDESEIVNQAHILDQMLKGGVNGRYYPTGINGWDSLMGGGLYEGKVYGLSGRAKSGKTLLASTISYNIDCRHLYVAMEMGAPQITQRKLARQGGFNSLSFLDGTKTLDGLKPDLETYYLDSAGITWDALLTKMVSSVIKLQVKGVIIDYWQLIQGQGPRETEEKHLRTVAQGIADFAKNHGVWVLLLSQTNENGQTFAGQGLIKACDQLWYIETPKNEPDRRWLRMGASRYTPHADYGGEDMAPLLLDKRIGPHFKEA
jgi:replicative DNA helicase